VDADDRGPVADDVDDACLQRLDDPPAAGGGGAPAFLAPAAFGAVVLVAGIVLLTRSDA